MGFKNDDDFNSDSYVKVNERLKELRADFPEGFENTHRCEIQDKVIYKCFLFRNLEEAKLYKDGGPPASTGHGILDKKMDEEKAEEYTETVALGRALAKLGYKVEKSLASREEMEKFEKTSKFRANRKKNEEEEIKEEKTPEKKKEPKKEVKWKEPSSTIDKETEEYKKYIQEKMAKAQELNKKDLEAMEAVKAEEKYNNEEFSKKVEKRKEEKREKVKEEEPTKNRFRPKSSRFRRK